MAVDIRDLSNDPEAAELLSDMFEFRLAADERPADWYGVDGAERLDLVARDAGGGEYMIAQPSGRALFVSSEG
jgi:hypothetical protein